MIKFQYRANEERVYNTDDLLPPLPLPTQLAYPSFHNNMFRLIGITWLWPLLQQNSLLFTYKYFKIIRTSEETQNKGDLLLLLLQIEPG